MHSSFPCLILFSLVPTNTLKTIVYANPTKMSTCLQEEFFFLFSSLAPNSTKVPEFNIFKFKNKCVFEIREQ